MLKEIEYTFSAPTNWGDRISMDICVEKEWNGRKFPLLFFLSSHSFSPTHAPGKEGVPLKPSSLFPSYANFYFRKKRSRKQPGKPFRRKLGNQLDESCTADDDDTGSTLFSPDLCTFCLNPCATEVRSERRGPILSSKFAAAAPNSSFARIRT